MRHDDIRTGQSYVGRGMRRRTRRVLVIGDADACQIPQQHRAHLKLAQTWVRYETEDGTTTYADIVSFAQWATSIADEGWPRSHPAGFFSLDVLEDGQVAVDVHEALEPDLVDELVRWLREAARDGRASRTEDRPSPEDP